MLIENRCRKRKREIKKRGGGDEMAPYLSPSCPLSYQFPFYPFCRPSRLRFILSPVLNLSYSFSLYPMLLSYLFPVLPVTSPTSLLSACLLPSLSSVSCPTCLQSYLSPVCLSPPLLLLLSPVLPLSCLLVSSPPSSPVSSPTSLLSCLLPSFFSCLLY